MGGKSHIIYGWDESESINIYTITGRLRITQYTMYKAESASTMVIPVDPRYTSQKCSRFKNIKRRGMERVKESKYVGRGTPEFTPVEIGSIPEKANPVVETGSSRALAVRGCHVKNKLNTLYHFNFLFFHRGIHARKR